MPERIFIPEVEAVYHKDYQCDYYRGLIIDGDDNIVERCKELHSNYDKAKQDAERKIANSPLYSKHSSQEMKDKLEEYKRQKEALQRQNTVSIYDPGEWDEWQYIYDKGLYRFRYVNQNRETSNWITRKSESLIGTMIAEYHRRSGESDKIFYLGRVKGIPDIEKLPGHKDIWKINSVTKIEQKENKDCYVTIRYHAYGNVRQDYRKREKEKTIKIESKWECFNELMDRLSELYID